LSIKPELEVCHNLQEATEDSGRHCNLSHPLKQKGELADFQDRVLRRQLSRTGKEILVGGKTPVTRKTLIRPLTDHHGRQPIMEETEFPRISWWN
jgi:hypothetical protein